jgi:hypothetical protein
MPGKALDIREDPQKGVCVRNLTLHQVKVWIVLYIALFEKHFYLYRFPSNCKFFDKDFQYGN